MITKNKKMVFEAIAIKDDIAYAADYYGNGLYKVDMLTGKCHYVSLFEGESTEGKRLYCQALWINSKVYFIPASAKRIAIYTPEQNSLKFIEIPAPEPKKFSFYKAKFKFIRAFVRNDNLWLVPCSYPGIIKLDIRTNAIRIYDEWIGNDEYFFRIGVSVEDNRIIAANGKNNAVLDFDTDKKKGTIMHIGSGNSGVMHICKDENTYWLAPRLSGTIVRWNQESDAIKEYDGYPDEFESGGIVFSYVYKHEENIIFMPSCANKGVILNIQNATISTFDVNRIYNDSCIEYLFETEDEVYFREMLDYAHNRFFKLRKSDNSLCEYEFFLEDNADRAKDIIEKRINEKQVVKEINFFNLEEFIRGLV